MSGDYNRLALHNSECNPIYYQLQDCQRASHLLRRIFGECSDLDNLMRKCIAEQRRIQRERNLKFSLESREKLRQVLATEKN